MLEINKFSENECLSNFEMKFKFFSTKCKETTHTRKYKRTHRRKKQNGRDEARKTNDSSCRGKPNKRRERKPGKQVSIPPK